MNSENQFIKFSARSKAQDKDYELSKDDKSFLKKLLKKKSTSSSHEVKPNKFLQAGKKLPKNLQNQFVASKLSGTPLEEIDEYYKQNEHTFVVINKSKQIFRFSSKKALLIFGPEFLFRRLAIYLLTHSYPLKLNI